MGLGRECFARSSGQPHWPGGRNTDAGDLRGAGSCGRLLTLTPACFQCDDAVVAFPRLLTRQEQCGVTELVPVIVVADRFVVGLLGELPASDGLDEQQM